MLNFEGLEQMRYEATSAVMVELVKMVQDSKLTVKDRLDAAKRVDSMSDTLVFAQLHSQHIDNADKHASKLTRQLDKLTDKDKED